METFMVTFMVKGKSRNLCRRANHQLRASEIQGTDKPPVQRVHGSNHEGLMVGAGLFGVGGSGGIGQRPIATGHADAVRRSA